MTQYWWANQGVTYREERALGVLWAPVLGASGQRERSFLALAQMRPGDVVFHYAIGSVRAVSQVVMAAREGERPYRPDERIGREVRVHLQDIPPLLLAEVPRAARQAERFTGSAFNTAGGVNNGFAFTLSPTMGRLLLELTDALAQPGEETTDEPVDEDGQTRHAVYILETDGTAIRKYRKEQGWLSAGLFGAAAEAGCDLCGRVLPRRLLRTAHIKPRARCTADEKRDPHVVFAVCVLGCDALFEDRYIVVDDHGTIQSGPAAVSSSADTQMVITALAGRNVPRHSPDNAHYFQWHRTTAR